MKLHSSFELRHRFELRVSTFGFFSGFWFLVSGFGFPMSLIQINHLDFAYKDRLVLKQITLDVAPKSTLGLIGPNGGGKTTLLRLLLGLHEPTRGSIRIAGLAPRDAVRRGDVIGYLPQKPAVPANF